MDASEAREILGVSDAATREEVRRAYLRLSHKVHADVGGSDALFRQVKMAYDTLERGAQGARPGAPRDASTSDTAGGCSTTSPAPSPLGRWARANPSLALLLAGVFSLVVVVRSDAIATPLPMLGTVALVLGVAGLLGATQVRARGGTETGGALLKSQLRAGTPRLLRMLGRAMLVGLVASLTLGVLIDHSRRARVRR